MGRSVFPVPRSGLGEGEGEEVSSGGGLLLSSSTCLGEAGRREGGGRREGRDNRVLYLSVVRRWAAC